MAQGEFSGGTGLRHIQLRFLRWISYYRWAIRRKALWETRGLGSASTKTAKSPLEQKGVVINSVIYGYFNILLKKIKWGKNVFPSSLWHVCHLTEVLDLCPEEHKVRSDHRLSSYSVWSGIHQQCCLTGISTSSIAGKWQTDTQTHGGAKLSNSLLLAPWRLLIE